jgi:aminoglycoside/choline kinase family phosphotransferase
MTFHIQKKTTLTINKMDPELNPEISELKKKLGSIFPACRFSIEPIDWGASVRKYFLLLFENHYPDQLILMQIPPDRLEIADNHLQISEYFLKYGIPHPRLYQNHRDKGWLLEYPAVGLRLDLYFNAHPELMLKIYPELVFFLIDMQDRGKYDKACPAFQRFFDEEKYQYEFQFLVKKQLLYVYYKHRFSRQNKLILDKFTSEISRFLDSRLPFFVHRDFQSSNIFYDPDQPQNNIQIIDFQDARSGSLVYDLVSLMWDSYVPIPADLQYQMVNLYYENQPQVRIHLSREKFEKMVDFTVIQRKLHDAGAFAYTYNLLRKNQYLKYIDDAIEMALLKMRKYPQFQDIIELFSRLKGE